MNKNRFLTVAVVVLLMCAAFMMGSCKKTPDQMCVPESNTKVEVGESKILHCLFNKGKAVEWSSYPNDILRFNDPKRLKLDETEIVALKEGTCCVKAVGEKGPIDSCHVTVKTYIRPTKPIEFYKDDTATFSLRTGHKYTLYPHDTAFAYGSIQYHQLDIEYPPIPTYPTQGVSGWSYKVKALHVGEKYIQLRDTMGGYVVDTGLIVRVLPRHPNYWQPLDFNDTQDSVKTKIGTLYTESNSEDGTLLWDYYNVQHSFLLQVNFDEGHNNYMVTSYDMAFSEEETKAEVIASIEERCEHVVIDGIDIYFNGKVVVGTQNYIGMLLVVVLPTNITKNINNDNSKEIQFEAEKIHQAFEIVKEALNKTL